VVKVAHTMVIYTQEKRKSKLFIFTLLLEHIVEAHPVSPRTLATPLSKQNWTFHSIMGR